MNDNNERITIKSVLKTIVSVFILSVCVSILTVCVCRFFCETVEMLENITLVVTRFSVYLFLASKIKKVRNLKIRFWLIGGVFILFAMECLAVIIKLLRG